MDKGIRCNLRSQWELDTWKVRGHQVDPTDWIGEKRGKIEREKERGKDRRNSKERGSHFSLDFPMIGPSNPGETRGKVGPHCKSYA